MCKYLDKQGPYKGMMEVPDPYYGGAKGFELVSGPSRRAAYSAFPCAGVSGLKLWHGTGAGA